MAVTKIYRIEIMRLTPDQARRRLRPQGSGMRSKAMPLVFLRSVKSGRKDRAYLFGDGERSVIAPANDLLPARLAEFEGHDLNPAAELMLKDYARAIKAIQDDGVAVPTAEPTGQYVAPILGAIAWHQHEPFNDNLSFVEYKPTPGITEKCIVGCPATAVAQLIYYWAKQGKARGCTATKAYTSKAIDGYRFKVPAEPARTSFDFANMLDVYTKRKSTGYVDVVKYNPEQAKAVADLCAHIGKAMQMYYAPTGSGQYPAAVVSAIEQYLHLGDVTQYSQPTTADADDTLYLDKVRESLYKGVPVIVCGYTSKKVSASGHWFLVDGYRPSDDMYHVNWGWGPNFNNGWFAMSLLSYLKKESSFNFSFQKTFIVFSDVPSIYMDVNNDGKINMSDVTKVLTDKTGNPMHDVNYDGEVGQADAEAIINKVLNKG